MKKNKQKFSDDRKPIMVPLDVHHALKIKAAREGQSIGEIIAKWVRAWSLLLVLTFPALPQTVVHIQASRQGVSMPGQGRHLQSTVIYTATSGTLTFALESPRNPGPEVGKDYEISLKKPRAGEMILLLPGKKGLAEVKFRIRSITEKEGVK